MMWGTWFCVPVSTQVVRIENTRVEKAVGLTCCKKYRWDKNIMCVGSSTNILPARWGYLRTGFCAIYRI